MRDPAQTNPAYNLIEHRHRFAAWTAARAASRGGPFGIKTVHALAWCEAVGLRDLLADSEKLPDPAAFDEQHRAWRNAMIRGAAGLTHGKSAKLINVYLKAGVVCASSQTDGQLPIAMRERLGAIHPPIDSVLLAGISEHRPEMRKSLTRLRWSALGTNDYDHLIDSLKSMATGSDGVLEFWRLEEFWKGYRS